MLFKRLNCSTEWGEPWKVYVTCICSFLWAFTIIYRPSSSSIFCVHWNLSKTSQPYAVENLALIYNWKSLMIYALIFFRISYKWPHLLKIEHRRYSWKCLIFQQNVQMFKQKTFLWVANHVFLFFHPKKCCYFN